MRYHTVQGQFPLQVWLLDAMERPTPIEIVIHATTIVATIISPIA